MMAERGGKEGQARRDARKSRRPPGTRTGGQLPAGRRPHGGDPLRRAAACAGTESFLRRVAAAHAFKETPVP